MADETEKGAKERKTTGPMKVMICKEGPQTEKGERTFIALKQFQSIPTAKDLKAAVKELGEGEYQALIYRNRKLSYKVVQAEKFDL